MSSEIWVALLSEDTSTARFPKELGPYMWWFMCVGTMLTGQVMQYSQASMPFPSCTALTSPCSSVFTFHILDLITHDVHGKHSLFSSLLNRIRINMYTPPISIS